MISHAPKPHQSTPGKHMSQPAATRDPLTSDSPWGLFVRGYGDTKVEYHQVSDWLASVECLRANGKPLIAADDMGSRLVGITDWTEWHCIPADALQEQADQWAQCGYDLRTAKGRRALATGGASPSPST